MGFTALNLSGVSNPAYIQRACLDPTTGLLTVYFSQPTDACGSFSEQILYGRDDIANPFVYLGKNSNPAAVSLTVTLPNKKQWQVYLVTRYSCGSTDTFSSNYIYIDNTPPSLLNLDSVSIEKNSQQIIAGWSMAPEPDVMGYSIFKVDPGTGNNILLKDTASLFYRFSTSTFNSVNTSNRIAIAVFDSCYNGGVISNYHSPVLASFSMSANANYRCTKKFTFSWSQYIGWSADHYSVWFEQAGSGVWVYLGDVTNTSYIFDIPTLNESYRFFVRAHKSSGPGGITSSSNIISVSLPGHPKPSQNEIGHVSVINSNTIEITGKWTSSFPGYTGELYYSDNGFMWNKLQNTNNNFITTQNNLLVNNQNYYYKNIVFNPCGDACDTSETHASILLSRNGNQTNWSPYTPWQPTVINNLEKKTNIDLFWGGVYSGTNNSYLLSDTTQGVCYRIKAVKENNEDSAFSNIICLTVKDTTLIPSGFNPEGNNKRFAIVNPNIAAGQSTMSVFDRWGGKLWEGDALLGWDGKTKEDLLPTGLYIYKVVIKRPVKNELYAGTVFLMR